MNDYLKKLARRGECGSEIIECCLCKKNLNGLPLWIVVDEAYEEPITICEECYSLKNIGSEVRQ